jgi:hypothetical protein
VCFAGSLRSDQRDGVRRPIRPGVDQRQRAFISGPRQEILPRKTLGVIERECQLTRRKGRDGYDGLPPV